MSQTEERRKIAVDFDGTIVEDRYPQIGRERPFALQTLRSLQEKGFVLVLWTCRTGEQLAEAVEFCRRGGVEFYGVNENFDGEMEMGAAPRKIDADIYIDDRNIGGLPSWGEIYHKLIGEPAPANARAKSRDEGLLGRLGRWMTGE